MVSKLFSSAPKTEIGAPTLPPHLASIAANLKKGAKPFLKDPNQFFRPMDITGGEQLAQQAIMSPFEDPQAYRQQIETFLSPYRDIISQDINRQFQGPQGALAAQASEAGAFGGSRHRGAQSDLERARLDALTSALQGQYNVAQGQMQQGIGNLLGFGGFQRGLDLQQRQAPVAGLQAYQGAVSPLFNAPTFTPVTTRGGGGFFNSPLGKLASQFGGTLISGKTPGGGVGGGGGGGFGGGGGGNPLMSMFGGGA